MNPVNETITEEEEPLSAAEQEEEPLNQENQAVVEALKVRINSKQLTINN